MSVEPPLYSGTCKSCCLGDVFDNVCTMCGAIFCRTCKGLRKPQSNLPDKNCTCPGQGWKKGWRDLKDEGNEPPGSLTE